MYTIRPHTSWQCNYLQTAAKLDVYSEIIHLQQLCKEHGALEILVIQHADSTIIIMGSTELVLSKQKLHVNTCACIFALYLMPHRRITDALTLALRSI